MLPRPPDKTHKRTRQPFKAHRALWNRAGYGQRSAVAADPLDPTTKYFLNRFIYDFYSRRRATVAENWSRSLRFLSNLPTPRFAPTAKMSPFSRRA